MVKTKGDIVIVGGGLVGALNACVLAKRGFNVKLYEMRQDIRTQEHMRGRSINLALSCRGREALKLVGLEEQVVENGIPMRARMIHDLDGTTRPIPYGEDHQYIMSVDRRNLNIVLLNAAEHNNNIELFFERKLVNCDFDSGSIVFERPDKSTEKVKADLIIGCDGAFSAVRGQLMKKTRFNYQQEYIPHGYLELTIHPKHNEFAMGVNYLHIWPRNEFMMIALPNQNKTFTTTLFMPFDIYETLDTEAKILNFFEKYYPDSIPLLGKESITETIMNNKAQPLVSIKCRPYHFKDKGLIMGDAAHAMVPFYGQGMNAGFEDCIVLNDLMAEYGDDISKVVPAFTDRRHTDATAICDLAMYNYIEMRSSVNSRLFLLRKKVDNFLHRLFPRFWIPLYTMVSFTRTPYHECIQRRAQQDKQVIQAVYTKTLYGYTNTESLIVQRFNKNPLVVVKHRLSNIVAILPYF